MIIVEKILNLLYVEGIYDEDMALKQLKFSKSNNQVSLHTSKALSRLEFIGRDEYDKMKGLRIFKNELFGEIRWVKVNNKDYAVGIDIAKALGYKNPNDAISTHCKGSVKHGVGIVTGKRKDGIDAIQNVEMSIITSDMQSHSKY